MRTQVILILALVFSIGQIQAQKNDTISHVKFKIGNMGISSVKGTFTGISGEVNFNTDLPSTSTFNVCIDAATVNTKIGKRDKHLRNEDFFYVEKYPTICFESKAVTKTKSGYSTKGTLTMLGMTKEVNIVFTPSSERVCDALPVPCGVSRRANAFHRSNHK